MSDLNLVYRIQILWDVDRCKFWKDGHKFSKNESDIEWQTHIKITDLDRLIRGTNTGKPRQARDTATADGSIYTGEYT